jgi:hypothetical protein
MKCLTVVSHILKSMAAIGKKVINEDRTMDIYPEFLPRFVHRLSRFEK